MNVEVHYLKYMLKQNYNMDSEHRCNMRRNSKEKKRISQLLLIISINNETPLVGEITLYVYRDEPCYTQHSREISQLSMLSLIKVLLFLLIFSHSHCYHLYMCFLHEFYSSNYEILPRVSINKLNSPLKQRREHYQNGLKTRQNMVGSEKT